MPYIKLNTIVHCANLQLKTETYSAFFAEAQSSTSLIVKEKQAMTKAFKGII